MFTYSRYLVRRHGRDAIQASQGISKWLPGFAEQLDWPNAVLSSFGKSTGGPATVSDRYAETGPSGSRCLRSVPISEPLSKRHSTTAYTAGYYPGWIAWCTLQRKRTV